MNDSPDYQKFVQIRPYNLKFWFWFWFSNQQDSFTNMIADGSAWGLMCQFRLK